MFVAATPGARAPMSEHSTSSRGVDHHDYQQPPLPQQSRSLGLGIRRAKAATGNSIKRLFKHSSKPDSNSGMPRRAVAEPIDSPSPPGSSASLHVEPIHVHRPYVESCRPPSARSAKSVRSIFSSARRITLRPSTLFRKHTLASPDADMPASPHAAPASDFGSPYGSPRMSQSLPGRPASPLPLTTAASDGPKHSPMPPMGQWMRHASNIKAERARNNPIEYAESPSTNLDDWHSTAPSVQRLRRCPPMPINQALPPPPPPQHQPAIATPEHSTCSAPTTASVSAAASISASVEVFTPPSVATTTKSPMSFSSKSLGLSLLDFGYSERTVHDSLPSPSSPESAASGPPSPSPPTSSLSSPLEQVVYEQMGLGLSENCPHYTIDLLDCKLTNGGSGYYPDSHILATPSPAPPRLNLWTSIVCTLGAPEPVCAAAVSVCAPATTPEDGDKLSPFVICGIDDLLLELGVTGSALIPNDLLLSPPTIPMFSADADVLSLREIDELIEQLGHSHASSCIGCLDYCGQPRGMSPSLDIAALGSSLGCVTDIAATLPTDNKALASLLVDPAAIVAELGCAGALVLFLPPASTLNIDCIIRQLGDVSIAAQLVPLPQPRKHAPALGVVGLVCELGEAIEPKYSCPCLLEEEPLAPLLDIAKMVEMLGSPIDVVRVALLQTTAAARFSLAKGLMRTPEPGTAVSLAGLGGVYTSEWLVHDMEQVHKQTIVDTLAAYSFLEFPHIPPQCSAPALGESRMSLELAGTGMDVDEAIFDTRSRSSSMSLEHPDSAQYINRLIAALRIPPIVVSRPFLGPRRNMLFPRLC